MTSTPTRTLFALALTILLAPPQPTGAADKPDLSGTWVLNAEESEDPFEIMRDRLDNRRRVYSGGLPGGPSRRRPGIEPSPQFGQRGLRRPDAGIERLEIVHVDPRVSIRFADDRERVFFTDGRAPSDDFELGLLAASARWKKGTLVFSAESAYGGKIKETYALTPDGTKLTVTIKREGSSERPGVIFDRVYDRVETWKEDQ